MAPVIDDGSRLKKASMSSTQPYKEQLSMQNSQCRIFKVPANVSTYAPLQLEGLRKKIYRLCVPAYSLLPKANGSTLTPANKGDRGANLQQFIDLYFYKKEVPDNADPFSNNYQEHTQLKPGSDGYKAFERFAQTDYGSALIKEMIQNQKKYTGFYVAENALSWANGGFGRITFPRKFPNSLEFRTSGQKVHDLAIIWHEFAHSMVFRSPLKKDIPITIYDERDDVLKFENPVRMGANFEPRYSYTATDKSQTINIITREVANGEFTVSKFDPRKLVRHADKEALK